MKTRFTITVQSNKKDNTIDFLYKRKDLVPVEDMKEKAFLIFVEQVIRTTLDNGFTINIERKEEDGKSVEQ